MKQLILGLVFVSLNCWGQRPPPSDFPRAQKVSITEYITSFQSYRDKNNKYIRVEGLIPEVCADKIKLNYKCDEPTNMVTFIFKDATGDALSCLKTNQNLCSGQKHKDCVTLDKLARKSKDNSVINKVVFKKSESEDCSKIQVSTAKVAFQTKSNEVVSREEKTEAGVCIECMKTKEPGLAKLQVQAEEMKEKTAVDSERERGRERKERSDASGFEDDESPRERPQRQAKQESSSSGGRPSMSGGMGGPSSSGAMANMLSSVLTSLMSLSYSQSMNSYGASYGYPPYSSGYMNYGYNQNYMNSSYMNYGYNQNYNYSNYNSMNYSSYPYSYNQNYYTNSGYYPYSNYYTNYNYGNSSYIPQYPYSTTSYNSYYNSTLPSLGTATSTVINGR